MNKIYKYVLEFKERQEISLPKGFEILTVDIQINPNDLRASKWSLCLWAIVNSVQIGNLKEYVTFEVIATGQDMPNLDIRTKRVYINTVQIHEYVWHIFRIERTV